MTCRFLLAGAWLLALLLPAQAAAHNIAGGDASFVAGNTGAAIVPFIYMGAKHMVTGFDHLLFLAGVIFFLRRPGHSITLLFGVLADVRINAYLVDAIIALSVVYKALENMGALDGLGKLRPNTHLAVFGFGLVHGFGLASSLQELNLSADGLITNLISFNIGVEIGQVIALFIIFTAFTFWRSQPSFSRHAFVSNAILMCAGFTLMIYQLTAWQLGL